MSKKPDNPPLIGAPAKVGDVAYAVIDGKLTTFQCCMREDDVVDWITFNKGADPTALYSTPDAAIQAHLDTAERQVVAEVMVVRDTTEDVAAMLRSAGASGRRMPLGEVLAREFLTWADGGIVIVNDDDMTPVSLEPGSFAVKIVDMPVFMSGGRYTAKLQIRWLDDTLTGALERIKTIVEHGLEFGQLNGDWSVIGIWRDLTVSR